jgi:hypothetical protein
VSRHLRWWVGRAADGTQHCMTSHSCLKRVGPTRPLPPAQIPLNGIDALCRDLWGGSADREQGRDVYSAGLDKQVLSICVGMIEQGANPDTLAVRPTNGICLGIHQSLPLCSRLCRLQPNRFASRHTDASQAVVKELRREAAALKAEQASSGER